MILETVAHTYELNMWSEAEIDFRFAGVKYTLEKRRPAGCYRLMVHPPNSPYPYGELVAKFRADAEGLRALSAWLREAQPDLHMTLSRFLA